MKKMILREKDNKFCRLEVTLENGRLSICGTAGLVFTEKQAREEALLYWKSFFDDQPEELALMNQRQRTRFRSSRRAAQYVLDNDGQYHGLDIVEADENKVYIGYSFGQIIETLSEWFPEVVPYLPWHLNNMRAGCHHQRAADNQEPCSEVECLVDGQPYIYGSAWKVEPLPDYVLDWFSDLQSDKAA